LFAQQEFALQNRFFLTLGLRRDFASAIGADAPSIWYPKASFAMRLDQFPGLLPRQLNFLKLRSAYGETGQLPGILDASRLRWEAEPSGYGAGAVLNFIGNPEIEPERIRELEFGFEAEAFNNIGLDLTYYLQWAEDSIIDRQLPPSTGQTATANATFTGVPFNVGEAKGWGLEASLSAAPLHTNNFGLDFTFIFDDDGTYTGVQPVACEDASGNPVDCSAEGSVAAREFLGTPYPKHNGSFSLNFRFLKNFNLYALADWSLDQKVYNGTAFFQVLFGGLRARNEALVNIGQAEPGDVGLEGEDIPVYDPGTPEYRAAAAVVAQTATSARGASLDGNFVESADFFKLREISLRYDFTDLLRKARFSRYVRSLSFTLSARNIWTTSDYSGPDPEINFTGARSSTRANDFLTLPSPRTIYGTITVGL
jgi:hypothetical protein